MICGNLTYDMAPQSRVRPGSDAAPLVPNLTDELSTAKERPLNQFGTPVFSNLVRKKR